jgi:hypothetical protein
VVRLDHPAERNDDDGKHFNQPVEQGRDPVVTERFPYAPARLVTLQ